MPTPLSTSVARAPSVGQALIPVGLLVCLLAASVALFGDASSSGPNQIALILSAGAAALVGVRNGHSWKTIERGISQGISVSVGALLILLVVGSLIGAWILAGAVPTMIYYGLQLLSPSVFYAAACVICAFVSLAIGSSWTTAGTIGIALVGIAAAQGLHMGLAVGAIVSGAYFGDKMSVLSDTTTIWRRPWRAPTCFRTSGTWSGRRGRVSASHWRSSPPPGSWRRLRSAPATSRCWWTRSNASSRSGRTC